MQEFNKKQKVIIIEGPDNCGKDTVIKHIQEHFNANITIHCSSPLDKDNTYGALQLKDVQNKYINFVIDMLTSNSNRIYISPNEYDFIPIIFNRSMYTELIYGPKYRSTGERFIKDYITNYEESLIKTCKNFNAELYYIQLNVTNSDLLVNNEDGKSLSEGKKSEIDTELEMFDEIFNEYVHIENKYLVNVDIDGTFRAKKEIFNEVDKILFEIQYYNED